MTNHKKYGKIRYKIKKGKSPRPQRSEVMVQTQISICSNKELQNADFNKKNRVESLQAVHPIGNTRNVFTHTSQVEYNTILEIRQIRR